MTTLAYPESAVEDSAVEGWRLVYAAQNGDEAAFGRLYEHYRDDVRRFVLSILPDWHLAQDIGSETFARALRAIPTLTYRGSDVGAWLFTIARNIIRDHIKSRRWHAEISIAEPPWDTPSFTTPEDITLARDRSAKLHVFLHMLGDDQRRCLELRFLREYTVQQTAEAMGRTSAAVKALQYRALRALADILPADLA
jgi:RNA polymerase sigma-70 factor (ECF subfamily)